MVTKCVCNVKVKGMILLGSPAPPSGYEHVLGCHILDKFI